MSIDLSKAKIGDKFRTRDGHIMVYTSRNRYILSGLGEYVLTTEEEFPIHNEDGDGWTKLSFYYFSDGTGNDGLPFDASNVLQSLREQDPICVPYGYELVEQVFDKPLDELIKEATKQFRKNDDVIAEEKELQRRQEVVELAEKLVTNELFAVTNHLHDMRELGAAINLDSPTEYAFLIAEEFVNNKSKYLKNGKL